MSPESRAWLFAVVVAALPRRARCNLLLWGGPLFRATGESRVEMAWQALGICLSLHSLRRVVIDVWQNGISGIVLRMGSKFLKTAMGFPGIHGVAQREIAKELKSIETKMHGDGDPDANVRLPDDGLPSSEILRIVQGLQSKEAVEFVDGGKKWAGIYHSPTGELVKLQNEVWGRYNCSNTLYEGVFPSIRKFEAELVSWVKTLLHGDAHTCGLLTSGGTESVLLAALAYREEGRSRGIATPRVIAANTCHPAIVKACHYFGMELTKIPVNSSSDFALTAKAVRKHITGDVVCIYASAPTFPHGVIDHVEDLGKLAHSKGVGLHVDNCLGGVLLSYLDMQDLTAKHQLWDFRALGVTSISTDVHKYGNASKGVSVVTFRNERLRGLTYVPVTDGCEGLYVTPTLQGARGGAIIAQAWATMLTFGNRGYMDYSAKIHKLHSRYQEAVNRVPGLKVLCTCHACIVPISSDRYNIYAIASILEEKGWNLFTGQTPPVVSVCIGERHGDILSDFEQDLQYAVTVMAKEPAHKPKGVAAVYGSMSTTPRAALEQVLCSYVDMRMSVKPRTGD